MEHKKTRENVHEMKPYKEENSSNVTRSGNNGSVFPKEKEHVSTMVGKKIAESCEKVVESVVDAVKKRKNKGKPSPEN